ncbi:protein phtf isoform X2 [Anabrus simplex]
MGLQEIVSWYQKKIGTYDKQQWERTIEQRILHGLTHVPKKTAKLKTELIDVDLVRGSSFPKAKPKHGLVTVTRLALMRLLLLPAYSRWWSQQTSPRVFALLSLLYILQLFNMLVYAYCTSQLAEDVLQHVSASEVLVPSAMMLVLSILHSQIVSPHTAPVHQLPRSKLRRVKRTKRRVPVASRSRTGAGSDSKSSPDTGSDKTGSIVDVQNNKYTKRVRLRRSSSEDVRRRGVVWDMTAKSCVSPSGDQDLPVSVEPEASRQRVRLQVGVEDEAEGDAENQQETAPLDDDGFESLNGNGSSENGDEAADGEQAKDGASHERKRSALNVDDVVNVETPVEPADKSPVDDDVTIISAEPKCGNIDKPKEINLPGKPFRNAWVQEVLTCRNTSPDVNGADVDTDASDTEVRSGSVQRERLLPRQHTPLAESSYNSSCESEDAETISSPGVGSSCPLLTEGTTSAGEWIGVTTNSEECSYSSELEESERECNNGNGVELNDHPFAWEFELSPTVILNPSCAASDRVSCTVWEKRDVKKADLSVLDISSAIIERVESMPENMDYFYGGMMVAVLLAALPSICRFCEALPEGILGEATTEVPAVLTVTVVQLTSSLVSRISSSVMVIIDAALGNNMWERTIVLIAMFERCMLATLFFFLLAVAERTFKQRFLYAKLFSHLTSFRRARKSELPHFRLNKVRNIKTWLSVRSYLKRRGPQRSVDVIVSAAFLITLLLLSFLSVECLKDSVRLHCQYNLEAMAWCLVLGVFLLRFMTLGTKINRKYRNLSVLITEQINLYLQIEQKPNKKEELMVANSVLKLAADLLKELESPFKISGLSANPYLYTITKVVILSALSGVLSELLGFKLKLHKIKIK